MLLHTPSSRGILWAFVVALLLKAAMPWLAGAAAHAEGKALVEVCTVYGVSLVQTAAAAGGDSEPTHSSDQGREHCVLTALTALAQFQPPGIGTTPTKQFDAATYRTHRSARASDACEAWAARLRHGPPPNT